MGKHKRHNVLGEEEAAQLCKLVRKFWSNGHWHYRASLPGKRWTDASFATFAADALRHPVTKGNVKGARAIVEGKYLIPKVQVLPPAPPSVPPEPPAIVNLMDRINFLEGVVENLLERLGDPIPEKWR